MVRAGLPVEGPGRDRSGRARERIEAQAKYWHGLVLAGEGQKGTEAILLTDQKLWGPAQCRPAQRWAQHAVGAHLGPRCRARTRPRTGMRQLGAEHAEADSCRHPSQPGTAAIGRLDAAEVHHLRAR